MKSLYHHTLETHIEELEKVRQAAVKAKKQQKNNKKERPRDKLFSSDGRRIKQQTEPQMKPMFVLAHELFDALPIHQFKYLGSGNWSEMVVKLEGIDYTDSESTSGKL